MLSVDQNGKFSSRDVTPGEYRLVVRPGRGVAGSVVGGLAPTPPSSEFANMPITVSSDMEDIVVMTRPGLSIIGQIVFAEPPPSLPSGLRVAPTAPDNVMTFNVPPAATVGKDLQFTISDIFGPLLLRAIGLPSGYVMKSVMLGATDITDTPTEFKPEDNKRLQIVVTSRVAALEGVVTGDDERPPDALLLLFPEEREGWKSRSTRVRTVNVRNGKFTLPGMLPGTYYVVALPQESVMIPPNVGPEFYEPFTKIATTVVLAEGEKRTIDLRIMMPPDGR
jgi:hypothetical protein